jgi:hypothetical protein
MKEFIFIFILYIVIPISVTLLLTYLDKKTNGTKYEKLIDSLVRIVDTVEQSNKGYKLGTIKKDKAMQLSKQVVDKLKLPIDDDIISLMIDKAVDEMNKKKEEIKNDK